MEKEPLFGLGKESSDTEHFNGKVYVNEILDFNYPMLADTVTFAPGVRNNWHIHQAGQILMVTAGMAGSSSTGRI